MKIVNCEYCSYEITCEHCIKWPPKPTCDYCRDFLQNGANETELLELSTKERGLKKYYKYAQFLEMFHLQTIFQTAKIPKEELKEMSKREIQEVAFASGVSATIDTFLHFSNPELVKDVAIRLQEDLNQRLKEKGEETINFDEIVPESKPAIQHAEEGNSDISGLREWRDKFFNGSWERMLESMEEQGSHELKKLLPAIKKQLREQNELS